VFKVTPNLIIHDRALSDGNKGSNDMNNMENGYALLLEMDI